MSRDPRDITLDKIQRIANVLLAEEDLSAAAQAGLDRIEALARNRDNPSVVEPYEGEEEEE